MVPIFGIAAVLLTSKVHGDEAVDLTKPIEDGCAIVHQASLKPCEYEVSWGCDLENNKMWVTDGCRGTFMRKTHPFVQIRCGEGISPDNMYECDLPIFEAKTDVEFYDPMGNCDSYISSPVVDPIDFNVPIPEFDVCFKNKSGHWNIFTCLHPNAFKQVIYTDETCTVTTKYHTKSHETIFENGKCNLSGGNYKMILAWDPKPCPVKEEGEPEVKIVCGFPGFKLKMRVKDRTKSFKYVEDACECSLLCQGDDAWQFHIKRGKCHCRAKPNKERINRTTPNKHYVSSFPIDEQR